MTRYVWDQSTGELRLDGKPVSRGYAGKAHGKNNPALQAAVGIGPIPRGLWRLVAVRNSLNTGPFTIVLEPAPGTDSLGRTEFRIHGDSVARPGTASRGCIILPRAMREAIWRSGERLIEVVE